MNGNCDDVGVREILYTEVSAAASTLGRGMRDNPLPVSALGDDPACREKALTGVFDAFLGLEVARKGKVLGAFKDGALIGVCGMMKPGCCQLTPPEKIVLLPNLLWNCGLRGTGRLLGPFGAWSKLDPRAPHWHLGPVGIEREWQGKGIGSLLMREFCRRVDGEKAAAWLETDKKINVRFYQKHGFEVMFEQPVNGTPN